MIKALTRELYPYGGEGTVRVCGLDRWVISQLRSLIGVVSEQRSKFLGSPTGLDLAVSGLIGTYGVTAQYSITPEMWKRAEQALERVNALRLAHQEVDTMSTGEQRRVWIARALISNPRALILDEPSNGLDLKAAHELFGTVQSLALSGVTIIMVTHHLEEIVPAIQRVILMSQGKIVADGPRQEVLKTDLLGKIFQVDDATLLRGIDLKLEAHRDAILSHSQ